jgi:3',5'-cyclic AMP phosphodiesterase CpdA
LPALKDALNAAQPDVLAISGDVTQRARNREFAEAKAFLDSLPFHKVVVPGNHDIPLYNVLARWLTPLSAYKRHFGDDEPIYVDEEIAVAGINTARSLTFQSGRINHRQVKTACSTFTGAGANTTRIIVTHHPFDDAGDKSIVGRAKLAVTAFAQCGVDLIVSGHAHVAGAGESTRRYSTAGRSMLLVHAGTATSGRRRRGEGNSFNLIKIDRPRISIDRMTWDPAKTRFTRSHRDRFQLSPTGWSRATCG